MINEKFFAVEIYSGGYIPHQWLFEDFAEQVLKEANFGGSNIYYLVKVPRVRYHSNARYNADLQEIHVDLLIGDTRLVPTALSISRIKLFDSIPFSALGKIGIHVDNKSTTNFSLGLAVTIEGETFFSDIPMTSYLAMSDFDLGFRQEILYIGQSFDMIKRWRNHKQVNRATSTMSDSEELRLYFFHFAYFAQYSGNQDARWKGLLDISDRESQEYRDRVSLIEQSLIQFYLPSLNSRHIRGTLDSKPYQRILDKTGTSKISLSLGMDGHAFQFFSCNQRIDSEVVTLVSNAGKPEFRRGLEFE